jgi:tRNA(adenine34) deaminase
MTAGLPVDPETSDRLVRAAQAEAATAAARGDPPFGAILATPDGEVLLAAANAQSTTLDPTAHAEITLIRTAARTLGRLTLDGLVVASNAEPCSMCLSALIKARVGAVVFGAPHEPHIDPAIAAAELVARSRHPMTLVGGILAAECAAQIAAARTTTPTAD